MTLTRYRAEAGVSSFLSALNSNPKAAKAEAKLGISTAILHLAPANMSGFEVCQGRSPGCTAACLHFAGSPVYQDRKNTARIKRTQYFFRHKDRFLTSVRREIQTHVKRSEKNGLIPAVRLNGTSDIPWERVRSDFGTLIDAFPDVQFYDYTSVVRRLTSSLPPNYHLTFSVKEDNLDDALTVAKLGFNLAAVFAEGLPSHYLDMPVIDGDEHDFRPADPQGVVVGLKVKGTKGAADQTGFVSRSLDVQKKNVA